MSRLKMSTVQGFFFMRALRENIQEASDPLMLQIRWDLVPMKKLKVRMHRTTRQIRIKHMRRSKISLTLYCTVFEQSEQLSLQVYPDKNGKGQIEQKMSSVVIGFHSPVEIKVSYFPLDREEYLTKIAKSKHTVVTSPIEFKIKDLTRCSSAFSQEISYSITPQEQPTIPK